MTPRRPRPPGVDLGTRMAHWLLTIRPDQVSPARMHRVRILLLDFLGCVLGASRLPEARTVTPLVRPGNYRVPGHEQTMDLPSACMTWGLTGALLQWHDGYGRGGNHPSSSVLPVLLAQSQEWGALLMPALVGYEIANRLAHVTHPAQTLAGSAPTSSMGAIGAAAALCRWQNLDAACTARALGLAGFWAPIAAFEGLRARGSAVPLHSGLAARAGYEAVEMARAGFDASETLLEGRDGPGLLAFLGGIESSIATLEPEAWRGDTLDQVYLKPFPGCRHVHPAVEAALGLRTRCAGLPADWLSIEIETYGLAASFGALPRPQAELYDCLMSLPWCVALALLEGEPTAESVSSDRARTDLWSIASRITVRTHAGHDAAYPAELGATLTIRKRDGTAFSESAVLRYASSGTRYSPEGPFGPVLDEQGCITKFVALTSKLLSAREQHALVHNLLTASPTPNSP